MYIKPFHILIVSFVFILNAPMLGQELSDTIPQPDSLVAEPIVMEPDQAAKYLDKIVQTESIWKTDVPMRTALSRLVSQYNTPYDSVRSQLMSYPYGAVGFQDSLLQERDTVKLYWLNDSSMIIPPDAFTVPPFHIVRKVDSTITDTTLQVLEETTEFEAFVDSLFLADAPEPVYIDTVLVQYDTVYEVEIDTASLVARGLVLYRYAEGRFMPPLPVEPGRSFRLSADSSEYVVTKSTPIIVGDRKAPFARVASRQFTDTLQTAVLSLADYLYQRDSVKIYFSDIVGGSKPFWLTGQHKDMYRYWIKNLKSDSITIWVGNPSKYEITLLLEDDVNINRMEKVRADDIPISTLKPETTLAKVEPLKPIPVFWEYAVSSSFAFNQTFLSNWSKGGESSLATMLDLKGEAKYTNKSSKTTWTNNGRIKNGMVTNKENGMRVNTDMVEISSQFNKVMKEKIDFSSTFYLKTQLLRGYNYPNDSVPIAKMFNPTTFTIGVGVEYKPFKNMEINFAPLSYKNTFVMDTALIDQTNHGIDADKRARQEMGGQLLIKNKLKVWDGLNISNSLRLFSNYFENPQNVDLDWEISLDKRINWYATVALNLHLIYDDNIRFPVLDDNDQPVKLPDGSIRKVPKLQFKEFIGLTFAFRF